MTPFEYIIPLMSIIVGLGITDVADSLNKLFQARERVRWHWLPLAVTLLAVFMLLQAWWIFYAGGYGDSLLVKSLGGFILLCISLISLYLFAAASLPSEIPEEGVDLREFYKASSRYIWGVFITSVVLATITSIIKVVLEGISVPLGPVLRNGFMIVLGLVLMFSTRWRVHCVVGSIVVLLYAIAAGALILKVV